jgi:hypothetical protein
MRRGRALCRIEPGPDVVLHSGLTINSACMDIQIWLGFVPAGPLTRR